MDPLPIVNALGGVATRQQLIAAGCSGYDLTRGVRLGSIRRVRQARYVSPAAASDAVIAARVGGLIAGPSAAKTYGWWGGLDTRLHLSVGDNSARLRTLRAPSLLPNGVEQRADTVPRRIRLHWLVGGAVPELGDECWRVPQDACLRQVLQWCDEATAIACLDTAVTVGEIPRDVVLDWCASLPKALRVRAGECRWGSESGTESLVRQGLDRLGVAYRQQVKFEGVGRVDFELDDARVIIEVDSRRHDDPVVRADDYRRDAELAARGYMVLRFSYDQVVYHWEWCARMVVAALAR